MSFLNLTNLGKPLAPQISEAIDLTDIESYSLVFKHLWDDGVKDDSGLPLLNKTSSVAEAAAAAKQIIQLQQQQQQQQQQQSLQQQIKQHENGRGNTVSSVNYSKRLNLHIIDTILFKSGSPFRWIFTSEKTHEVLKKKSEKILSASEIVKIFKKKTSTFKSNKDSFKNLRPKIANVWYMTPEGNLASQLVDEIDLHIILTAGIECGCVVAAQVHVTGLPFKGNGLFEHKYHIDPNGRPVHETFEYDGQGFNYNNTSRSTSLMATYNDHELYPMSTASNLNKINITETPHLMIVNLLNRFLPYFESQIKSKVANIVIQVSFNDSWQPFLMSAREITLWDASADFGEHFRGRACYASGLAPHHPSKPLFLNGMLRVSTTTTVYSQRTLLHEKHNHMHSPKPKDKSASKGHHHPYVTSDDNHPPHRRVESYADYLRSRDRRRKHEAKHKHVVNEVEQEPEQHVHDDEDEEGVSYFYPTRNGSPHDDTMVSKPEEGAIVYRRLSVLGPRRQQTVAHDIGISKVNGKGIGDAGKLTNKRSQISANENEDVLLANKGMESMLNKMFKSKKENKRPSLSAKITSRTARNRDPISGVQLGGNKGDIVGHTSRLAVMTETSKSQCKFFAQSGPDRYLSAEDQDFKRRPSSAPITTRLSSSFSSNDTFDDQRIPLQAGTVCFGDHCDFGHHLQRKEKTFYRSMRSTHTLPLKSILLARAEARLIGATVADEASHGLLEDNKSGQEADQIFAYFARRQIMRVAQKCHDELRNILIAGVEKPSKNQSVWDALNFVYRRLVYINALATVHPSRFYHTVPLCETCYKLYMFMDHQRESVVLHNADLDYNGKPDDMLLPTSNTVKVKGTKTATDRKQRPKSATLRSLRRTTFHANEEKLLEPDEDDGTSEEDAESLKQPLDGNESDDVGKSDPQWNQKHNDKDKQQNRTKTSKHLASDRNKNPSWISRDGIVSHSDKYIASRGEFRSVESEKKNYNPPLQLHDEEAITRVEMKQEEQQQRLLLAAAGKLLGGIKIREHKRDPSPLPEVSLQISTRGGKISSWVKLKGKDAGSDEKGYADNNIRSDQKDDSKQQRRPHSAVTLGSSNAKSLEGKIVRPSSAHAGRQSGSKSTKVSNDKDSMVSTTKENTSIDYEGGNCNTNINLVNNEGIGIQPKVNLYAYSTLPFQEAPFLPIQVRESYSSLDDDQQMISPGFPQHYVSNDHGSKIDQFLGIASLPTSFSQKQEKITA